MASGGDEEWCSPKAKKLKATGDLAPLIRGPLFCSGKFYNWVEVSPKYGPALHIKKPWNSATRGLSWWGSEIPLTEAFQLLGNLIKCLYSADHQTTKEMLDENKPLLERIVRKPPQGYKKGKAFSSLTAQRKRQELYFAAYSDTLPPMWTALPDMEPIPAIAGKEEEEEEEEEEEQEVANNGNKPS